ncbi:lamin tail domain-containing protein [Streptomyces somaliensis DSM 40738]|uniref:Lamin tail domain-containing protein n=1 Tax=Streptomyces somaliensis (strain ATCC 33201 / DSM 40738 / JCM 12659 / KCTC 9044 / NCTC 11332 / NRRL B-12077 / IP 733) TaxID=1134445 RepID=A0AA44IBU3_STRE0|nr:lamin tail domain-containing protein [Streptomyces somaliensis]MCQ0022820.1 lamin tail domain-containing protein [Streptomyces somaliensis DSM 40738]NKY12981.1 lamin tail domain-containing protein [Streptomyces somaliensis DSM 40738]
MNRAIRAAALSTAVLSLAALSPAALSADARAASTTGALMITHVRPNTSGADVRDGRQLNLNGEYFLIRNVTTRTVNTGGYVPDITSNTYGRVLPSYNLPAGAKAYVHTGSGTNHRDGSGWHHLYRGYGRHVLPNDARSRTPDLRLKKPGSPDDNTSTGSISSCNWNLAADGTTYAC